ncbi:MAG: hypothetical protein U1B30_15730 [Pseudomonadota bacterium]|nr:hypothetical protein [Pseudomonadota bacterium]
MVQAVTQIQALRRPSSHVLSKGAGDTLFQRWECHNSGTVAGLAFLRLRNLSKSLIIAASDPILVTTSGNPSLLLNITSLTASNFNTGANNMRLEMISLDQGTTPVATHDYTINFGAVGEVIINAIGDPVIS